MGGRGVPHFAHPAAEWEMLDCRVLGPDASDHFAVVSAFRVR
jgi:hypothetical protein